MTQIHTPRIKFPHRVIVKAPGLLPMMYTFRELDHWLQVKEWHRLSRVI